MPWESFPANQIQPEGWFLRLLRAQADGLTGHVHEIWEDLSDHSAWLGGSGEAWERGPYYLDGLVPLAWLLHDEGLLTRKQKWVEAILASQRPDGNFGPLRNPDPWPRWVAMKALMEEYSASRDRRILSLLVDYCRFLHRDIEKHPPHFWASARALEALEVVMQLQKIAPDPVYVPLIERLRSGMTDWFALFRDFPYDEPSGKYLPRAAFRLAKMVLQPLDTMQKKSLVIRSAPDAATVRRSNAKRTNRLMLETHGVNLAMALKYPLLYGAFTHQEQWTDLGKSTFKHLMSAHGQPFGLFSADEHLSGTSPTQGTELCAVVETMHSLAEMLKVTGDSWYADRLEILALNTLPAMFTPDMCRHQYVQQANQIAADRRSRDFFDTNREGNLYGLAPNYGCCLANLHQGFPKWALHQVLRTEEGLAVMGYAPGVVSGTLQERPFSLRISGEYPFGENIILQWITAPEDPMELRLRIPEGTLATITLDGKEQLSKGPGQLVIKKRWMAEESLSLRLVSPLRTLLNPDGSVSFWKGCVLLASPIAADSRTIRGTPPFTDVELKPNQPWNLAPLLREGEAEIKEMRLHPIPYLPFDGSLPPWELWVEGATVRNWKSRHHSAGLIPENPEWSDANSLVKLIPYGCTRLRISAFPSLKR